ncbi:TRAF-type zinc finger domain-containing protein 1 [Ambystoma mexicanum]|uniref:TRAF-type zinc finger domain-containing protein 1 n=1 Tax=Ambystoma mexicanum TaxID=8296 RepID=UPI0037E95C48
MASVTGAETRLCENCKKDIPVGNFTIHEIHCKRNIDVCTFCREPFPKSEMEAHIDTEHAQVLCKCNMKMEKRHLETHKVSSCPLRPAQCQYCELELAHNKVCDHEDYCGTRTESCSSCGRNVMVKDLQAHPTVCGKVTVAPKINSERLLSRYNHRSEDETWFDSLTTRNYLDEDPVRPQARLPRPFQSRSRYYKNVVQSSEGEERRRAHRMQVDSNLVDEEENVQSNRITGFSSTGVNSSNFDYLLALSLQNESPSSNNAERVVDHFQDFYSKDRSPSKYLPGRGTNDFFSRNLSITVNNSTEPKSNDIMLPCEFCEELIPEEQLIVHQTGCNPGTIVNSFTKRSPPPFHEFDYDGQLRTFLDQTSDPLNNRFAMLSDQSSSQTEGNIIIPCEFCGIPLENDNLFHHQDQCDLRPCTAVPTTRLWETPVLLPKKDNLEKSKSPQRRVRHQGDVTPSILDEPESIFTSPSGVFSIARTSQHKPSNTASDGAQLNSHLINKNHVDRVPMSHNGKPSTLQAPAAESTTNRQHDHSVQDFSGGSPTRRTTSWKEDYRTHPMIRNIAVHVNRNTKINQQPGPGDVAKEE